MKSLHQGELLKKLVDYKRLTDGKFSKILSVSRQTVSNWYASEVLPTKRLENIADALGVNVNVFFKDLEENISDSLIGSKPAAPGSEIDHYQVKDMKINEGEKVELLFMLCEQYKFKIYALQQELQVKDNLLKLAKGVSQPEA